MIKEKRPTAGCLWQSFVTTTIEHKKKSETTKVDVPN